MIEILIIDDEEEMLTSLKKILSFKPEYNLTLLNDSNEALQTVQSKKFDLIITDLKMKGVTGLDILRAAKNKFRDSKVIMISGYGTIEASVQAIKDGAIDFLEKPFTSTKLFDCIHSALDKDISASKDSDDERGDQKNIEGIIYQSKKIEDLITVIKRTASENVTILLTGESGTGKELFARAIHNLSLRKKNPFVPVNCGALPPELFESELFGHERGAFTGAVKTKLGLLEFANSGTFFFDEIGDLNHPLQIKLLRMLEERKIRRVGGQNEIDIDVRIIAATNKNLEKEVAEKRFREDLYYRLDSIRINIPPLRDRQEDIIPLANHFIHNYCIRDDKPVKYFSRDAETVLINYSWPGNVRELQNVISRVYYLSTSDTIQKDDLPVNMVDAQQSIKSEFLTLQYKDAKDAITEKFELEFLTYHLKKNKGNISKTADACGLDRRSIHRLINKYNIIYKEED